MSVLSTDEVDLKIEINLGYGETFPYQKGRGLVDGSVAKNCCCASRLPGFRS